MLIRDLLPMIPIECEDVREFWQSRSHVESAQQQKPQLLQLQYQQLQKSVEDHVNPGSDLRGQPANLDRSPEKLFDDGVTAQPAKACSFVLDFDDIESPSSESLVAESALEQDRRCEKQTVLLMVIDACLQSSAKAP